ncbi:MAG: sugar phosphate isomerase/epimerase [Pirellulales bacterium]|nr:sugar phosphate isomerase/epimerase [Pirellulales bacterium]
MQFGMNLLLWTDHLHDGLLPVLEMLKRQGWDGVEIPVLDLSLNYAEWGKRLRDLDLRCTAATARTAADNPISPDAKIRAAGVEATKRALDCCAALGSKLLIGPFHSALGEFSGKMPTADEWKWGIESMRQVSEYAGKVGVTLAIEFLNRFECYLLNHVADTVKFLKDVNHPNCRMMYDTFHANIEEKDPIAALHAAAPYTVMIHISENDRGTPGQGNIPWKETFQAIKDVKYDGWIVVEAFGLALPAVQAATKIWRRMYESEEQLSRDALAFLRTGLKK